MTFRRTGYGLIGRSSESVAWTHSWVRLAGGWGLRTLQRERGEWVVRTEKAATRLNSRVFEPGTRGTAILGTENRPLVIHDLAALSSLIDPRPVLQRMLPGADIGDHEIYAASTDRGLVMIPAFLLIQRLWAWSARALHALLKPNSLDEYLIGAIRDEEVALSSALTSSAPTNAAVNRIQWLAHSDDARRSWSSVYLNASGGRIGLELPRARLECWLWGAEVPAGFLACEVLSPRFVPLEGGIAPRVSINGRLVR